MTTQNINDSVCICPTCNSKLDRKSRFSEVKAHLYIDNFSNPDLKNYIDDLKSSRKLNRTIMLSLDSYRKSASVDVLAIKKSILRLETLISIVSDQATLITLKKELSVLRDAVS